MSETKIGAWRKNFAPDETGFPAWLETHIQHVEYLKANKVSNYLAKIDYPEHAGLNAKESLAKDCGISCSNLFYMAKSKPDDFVSTVRGFINFRSKNKSVSRDAAKVKGEELR